MNFEPTENELGLSRSIEKTSTEQPPEPPAFQRWLEERMLGLVEAGLFASRPEGGFVGFQLAVEHLAYRLPTLAWVAGITVHPALYLIHELPFADEDNGTFVIEAKKRMPLSVAYSEPEGGCQPQKLSTKLESEPGCFRLSGTKYPLAHLETAGGFLVVATSADGEWLCLVDPDAKGVTIEPGAAVPGVEPMALATLALEEVKIDERFCLGPFKPGLVLGRLAQAQRRFGCGYYLGICRRCLDAAIQWCSNGGRGKPPAGFQLARFGLAEMKSVLDAAEILCRRAAAAADAGSPGAEDLFRCARVAAAEAALELSERAVQLAGTTAFCSVDDLRQNLALARLPVGIGISTAAERMEIAGSILSGQH